MLKAFDELKKEWELELNIETTRRFIEMDSEGSFNKAEVFRRLGFKWQAHGKATAPDLYDFAVNFHQEMFQQGYQDRPYLRPAMVFVKKDSSVSGGLIYRLVDPLRTTEAPEGFRRLERSTENFNLPFSVVMQGLKDGLFPLMGGLHDVSHYIGLLQNKEMAVALVESLRKLPPKGSKHLGRRIILLMEYFTSMTGQPKSVVEKYLREELHIADLPTRLQIKAQLAMLSEQQLLQRASRSADLLDKVIVDFGGGSVAPWEKIGDVTKMLFDDSSLNGQLEFYTNIGHRKSTLKNLLAYHEQMFLEDKSKSRYLQDTGVLPTRYRDEKYDVVVRTYPRLYSFVVRELLAHMTSSDLPWSLDLVALRDMNFLVRKPRTSLSSIDGKVKIIYDLEVTSEGREYLKNVLADLTSAIEFQLAQAAYGLSSADQVKALLQPKLLQEDPFGSYLQQLYPGFIQQSGLLDEPI